MEQLDFSKKMMKKNNREKRENWIVKQNPYWVKLLLFTSYHALYIDNKSPDPKLRKWKIQSYKLHFDTITISYILLCRIQPSLINSVRLSRTHHNRSQTWSTELPISNTPPNSCFQDFSSWYFSLTHQTWLSSEAYWVYRLVVILSCNARVQAFLC